MRRETYSSFHFAEGFWLEERERERRKMVGEVKRERQRGVLFLQGRFLLEFVVRWGPKKIVRNIYIEFLLPSVFFSRISFFHFENLFSIKKKWIGFR